MDIIYFVLAGAVLFIIVFIGVLFRYRFKREEEPVEARLMESAISCFALMNQEGGRDKEWFVTGVNSFLIGKGTAQNEVDMELGDAQYSEYISDEHAVLNFSAGCWYLEDLSSQYGVGIRKRGEEFAFRLKQDVSYKVDVGDVIYISKAKIIAL